MGNNSFNGWFEISEKDWLNTRVKSKKIKLLADAQFPENVIREYLVAKINIKKIVPSCKNYPDTRILEIAAKMGCVLLTLDNDFWNDRKFPLHLIKNGIIYITEPPNFHERIMKAFGLIYGCFVKNFPLDWWYGMKVKAIMDEFEIKKCTNEGNIGKYKMRLRGGNLIAKEN